jgi:GDP-L-fucose synthase
MNKSSRIFVAGHAGLVGSAIVRRLANEGHSSVITRSRAELDLRDAAAVDRFISEARPEYVFLAAAKVGGIQANNTAPADFLRDNLLIQASVIDAAHRHGARKLLFLGSSCIYPKNAPQPITEEALLTGPLEPTNEWYAVAKIAGIQMCRAYRRQYGMDAIAAMPTNLYGPGDNFNLASSHVLPALLRKFHEAKTEGHDTVTIWGTGTPRREFLYVDDCADALVFLMKNYSEEPFLNVGTGEDLTITELARLVAEIVGFRGSLEFDASKPDGTLRKQLDVTRLTKLGWKPKTSLRDGIQKTYAWLLANLGSLRV